MKADLHRSWGRKVRDRRQAVGLTQIQLAEAADTTQGTISRIEVGDIGPSDELKWRLAGALGLTVELLFPYPAVVPPTSTPRAS